jgi:hypothetical protein
LPRDFIQGLRLCFVFCFNLALTDRNIQARFGVRGVWESWEVELWPINLVKSNIPVLHSLQKKRCKKKYTKNSLNVPDVKIFSKKNQRFWLFYAFLVRMTACTLHIKCFPWHQEPKWPQWPQQPQQPQWPQWPLQPHFIKKPLF